MKQTLAPAPRYDTLTIRLHWLTAGMVAALWLLGQTIDWFPRGAPRVFARSAHIGIGAILACVILYRIWWRLSGGARLSAAGTGALKVLAKSMHLALYACLLVTVALGIANTWIRGDNLFYLYKIPAFAPGDKALRAAVEDYHAFAANLLLILAGFHAMAGFVHRYVLKEDVLSRMLSQHRPK